MPTVHLPSAFRPFTGGLDVVTIDAARVHELLIALSARFPALAGQLEEMAVAIDGEIYQDPGYQPLHPDSEVHLVPRIAGGSHAGHRGTESQRSLPLCLCGSVAIVGARRL